MPTYSNTSRTLYRSRRGWIFGVCQGLAEYADISVFWVRFAAFIALLFTGFWPMVLIYIVAAIFLKPAPVIEFTNDEDWDFYQAYTADRKRALLRLKKRCEVLDRRTRRMENIVTKREYDWDRRFQSGI
jgi:phage shock protein C